MSLWRRRVLKPKVIGLRLVLFILGMFSLLLMTDTLSILRSIEADLETIQLSRLPDVTNELPPKFQDHKHD